MATTSFEKKGILIGCKGLVFAELLTDANEGTTYGTDIHGAPGVIEIALTAQVTNESIGADDVPLYEVVNSLDGFDVSITMAALGDDACAFLLGNTIDANGVRIEKSTDKAPYVAMGFITPRSDGSDDYLWLYKGKFAPGDATFRTKEKGSVNWQTPALTGSFMPRISDAQIRAIVNSSTEGASEILNSFFSTVYETEAGE